MPNFLEVCSGCGGLSLGFINKGFTPLLLNDNDKNCCKTLTKNHPNVKTLHKSMTDLDEELDEIEDLDLLMGGVPCQAFSHAGKRLGLEDDRGDLILKFGELIERLKPKVFLIENVKGLLTHEGGETLKFVLEKLNPNDEYDIFYKLLNANNYGVPQKRERVFIVGNRLNKNFNFPNPNEYKPVLKDVLIDCPSSPGITYSDSKKEIMELVPEGGCWIDLPEDIQKEYLGKSFYSGGGKRGIAKRLSMEEPCLTLTTSPSQKQTERCHPTETRPLQIREYARIQTFPDNFEFEGGINSIYKQIGNAVPVKLAEKIAESILKLFEE